MNINLVKICMLSNRCKNALFTKSAFGSLSTDYQKALTFCQCQFSTLTTGLTSKKYNETESVSVTNKLFNHWRLLSSDSSPPSTRLPPLMNFPKITWPSLIKSIRNFILTTFIIKPYFDHEFNLPDFVKGSKKAVEVVSKKLSEGDIKSLNGLVTNDILPTLQKAISLMSLPQREQIAVDAEDIYFSFPYQIGIIFNDDDEKEQKRFVEVTMVYHTLRGLAAMRLRGEEPPVNMGMLPEYQTRISICNYRFVREFTKGVEGDWTINLINHFKPSDEMSED